MKEKIYEVDLYAPVQKYLQEQGYTVYGEVNDCDVVAVREDELLIVELKLNLNIDLLIQATKRQRLTNFVYIAIPKPKYKRFSKKWHDMCHLIKRLELGLMVITFLKSGPKLEVIFPPGPFDRKRSIQLAKKKRNKLLEEINGRHVIDNIGGSNQTKIMTAYKENCIQIAYYLERYGRLSPKELRQLGTDEKTQSILYNNHYGWYIREEKGIYNLSELGKRELKNFPEVVKYFSERAKDPEVKCKSNEKNP
ncbi:DUF2161 domain-containing phosphodiesterase [Robertmurraya andreesenii]|uniref:Uncharacterized protein n=1 Tax=Anoxybacillus andreesenii TaxID=1325932 RepID=A0ABT9V0M5_9BACL|nr:DUF2161 family putative PD-(D/E)XK-type phosphodiesterase [Robertmurraya andreesenii]MDQ0154491.1 hypothetical protein [Robertmurraya andreesenii]